MRIAKGALASSVTLKNEAGINALTLTAKEPGSAGENIRAIVSYPAMQPEATFNIDLFMWDIQNGQRVKTRQESWKYLSMDSTSSSFAPTFLTQNSKLVDVLNVYATQTNLEEILPEIDIRRASIFEHLSVVNKAKLNTLLHEDSIKSSNLLAPVNQRILEIRKYVGCVEREVRISTLKAPNATERETTVYGGAFMTIDGILQPVSESKLGVYSENSVGKWTLVESFTTGKDGSFKIALLPTTTTPMGTNLFISTIEKTKSSSRSESFLLSLSTVHYREYLIT